jgi:hypothetical protein
VSNTRKLPRGTRYIDDGAGCLVRLPDSGDDVTRWVAAAMGDPRMPLDTRDYVASIGARMIRAIETGEGVIRR